METAVYLDHNASTPIRPEAADAAAAAMRLTGNGSSVHGFGRAVRRVIEEARAEVAALLDVPAGGIVFTSGGTEANNLALRGTEAETVFVSALEHVSVLEANPAAETVAATPGGTVDVDDLERRLSAAAGPVLVSVMAANNETGVVQPLEDVVALARRHGALVHTDAVQAAGKIAVRDGFGADMVSLSAHKIGGPQGVGALWVRDGVDVSPVLRGGGQELRRRAGTENAAGIAGFGAAARTAREGLADMAGLGALRDRLEREAAVRVPGAMAVGAGAERLPTTSCIAMPDVDSETQVMALDLAGVAVSAGSACSSGKVTRSHVLDAMALPDDITGSAIRVSLGWTSTEADIDRFLDAWGALHARRAANAPRETAA